MACGNISQISLIVANWPPPDPSSTSIGLNLVTGSHSGRLQDAGPRSQRLPKAFPGSIDLLPHDVTGTTATSSRSVIAVLAPERYTHILCTALLQHRRPFSAQDLLQDADHIGARQKFYIPEVCPAKTFPPCRFLRYCYQPNPWSETDLTPDLSNHPVRSSLMFVAGGLVGQDRDGNLEKSGLDNHQPVAPAPIPPRKAVSAGWPSGLLYFHCQMSDGSRTADGLLAASAQPTYHVANAIHRSYRLDTESRPTNRDIDAGHRRL
ncbi:unnamed protein product [Calicophoron daubneyi]|uniref:Uncharacterized protein n=1 Tax=Calicophoron daubneyi TaxID=300641 RepID=A0AAV2TQ28_CALDB